MIFRKVILVLFLLICVFLYGNKKFIDVYQKITENIPEESVITITDFKGNFSEDFTRELIMYIQMNKNVSFVNYDIHRRVLEENLRYSEPGFDDRYSETLPRLLTPDIGIIGSANLQRSNFIFKQREHFDYEINLVELNTGRILLNLNDRIQFRYNPPILLLLIMITLIIAVARWIIFLRNGYKVQLIMSIAIGVIALILVWYLL